MNDFLIYSVEDDHEISNLIRIALEKSDFEVRCFDDGESFLKTFEVKKPNLILLDLMLPGIQGDEILKTIRKDIGNDKIPIVILSAKSLLEDRITGLNNGADDYIVKPFNIKELISRINVHYRKFLKDKYIVKINEYTLDFKNEQFYKYDSLIELTSNEFKILKYLFLKQGNVVSRDELYNQIWGTNNKNNSRSVDMHIKSLREKIGDENKNFIKSIYGGGYIIEK